MAAISPINPLTVIAMKKRSMGAIMSTEKSSLDQPASSLER